MKTIHKFPLPALDDVVEIYMPPGARILTLQTQFEQPCIWAVVDVPEVPMLACRELFIDV